MSLEDAEASLRPIRSFAARLEIVEAALANHTKTPKPHSVAAWFCKQIKSANNTRNRYAHAHYRFETQTSTKLLPYGDAGKARVVTLDEIECDVASLRKLAGQFHELFRMGRVPAELHSELQKLNDA